MTEKLFNTLFTVGEVIELDHKVSYSMGNMYGKIWLNPTDKNIFTVPKRYIGIYDSDYQGIIDVANCFRLEFFRYLGIKPIELYLHIKNVYELNLSK